MTSRVDEALRDIPDSRRRVDAADDYLREVVRRVENVLGGLRPTPIDVAYVIDGVGRRIQLRQSRDSSWHVAWERDGEGSVALLSAPRMVRVEAFTEIAWLDHGAVLAPLEALVIAVSRELSSEAANRGSQLEVARRLEAMIEVAAGKLDGGGSRARARLR